MNVTNNQKWVNDDSEDEYEEENMIVKNNNPLPELNKEFRDNVLNVKHSLYDHIVLSPDLGTTGAQDNGVLKDYLDKLNTVYIMSIKAQNGKSIPEEALSVFPESSREAIHVTLRWITDFFNKNHISATIPYSDYIRKSLHDYQFVQNNSFEDD
jgi:hypothetical protein